jgi:HSP20 family protein
MRVTQLPETTPQSHNGVAVGIRSTHPAADVFETADEIVLELEVAGFRRENLTVDVAEHHVVVTGTRDGPDEARRYLRHERLGPRFTRTIELPHGTDDSCLRAAYGDGVLTVRAPRVPADAPRHITISPATEHGPWGIHADVTGV